MIQKKPPLALIFFKALTIAPLSTDAKAVGGALLDHLNSKTAQCDPSQASLARRLGIDRRAINDALNEVERFGFFKRRRHGGKAYRSAYEPNFALAALMVTDFESRRKGGVEPAETSPMHPKNRLPKRSRRAKTSGDGATAFGRQSSGDGATGFGHQGRGDGATAAGGDGATDGSGDGATRTLRINSKNLTRRAQAEKSHPLDGGSRAVGRRPTAPRPPQTVSGRMAEVEAREAQRRSKATGAWQRDLLAYSADLYKILVPRMSENDAAYVQATEAELARPGDGLRSILAATGPPAKH
ncbi:helix-turn-helix domain-containing protein [Rhizobium giardinii]|uniref:helix-turn-helix domain-containing protein n=1 Tax=Rhizobium giardinii TaxID=56731 RepID=UPI003D6E262F